MYLLYSNFKIKGETKFDKILINYNILNNIKNNILYVKKIRII